MDETPMTTEQPQMNTMPTEMPTQTTASETSTVVYASFGKRFLAVLIDIILVGFVTSILGSITGTVSTTSTGTYTMNPLGTLAGFVYYVAMIHKYGATVGKMALNIRVQDMTTGQNLDIIHAILREIVGKMLSGIALGLGYLWMLWNPQKQTWHDMIAKSIVVEVKK